VLRMKPNREKLFALAQCQSQFGGAFLAYNDHCEMTCGLESSSLVHNPRAYNLNFLLMKWKKSEMKRATTALIDKTIRDCRHRFAMNHFCTVVVFDSRFLRLNCYEKLRLVMHVQLERLRNRIRMLGGFTTVRVKTANEKNFRRADKSSARAFKSFPAPCCLRASSTTFN
jgi:hypothetical protein